MVNTALFTGLSGLRVHQGYIDVIGNNLANVSTQGFRGSRATFNDLLSLTVRAGSSPMGTFGGTNPMQLGHGAVMGTVDIDTSQGTFADTGRPMDLALQGRGFFTLTDGLRTFYTRVGTLGIDASNTLVDMRTGLRVMNSSGADITVPVSDTLPARATGNITFEGNLPAEVNGPLAEVVESGSPFLEGTSANKQATGTAGTGNQFDLTAFAGQSVLVSVDGGAQQTVTFPASVFGAGPVNASTVASAFTVAGLSVTSDDVAGTVDFDTVRLGDDATLKFDDGPGATGLLATLGMDASLVTGSETTATGTTDLAMLTSRNAAYADGDRIEIRGNNPDGSPFSDTFVYGAGNDGTTLQDLVNFLNATVDPAQTVASLEASGNLRISAVDPGPADMSLFIGDATGNTGSNSFPNFTVTQDGSGPDEATSSIDVIDSLGRTHTVTMTFTRSSVDPAVWDMVASMDPSEGTIPTNTISQIRFNNDGSFNVIGGGNNALVFSFNGLGPTQSVTVDLGTSGQFNGVSMLGDTATIAATDQDGYGAGTLLNVAFDQEGNLNGFYSNGQSQVLDTLRISMFTNDGGLLRVGDTLFAESPNSGDAIAATAGIAGAGVIRPGSLENSNVDIAEEFVNLIEAQRGFQANARVITTTDEMLAELINIVR